MILAEQLSQERKVYVRTWCERFDCYCSY